MFSLDLMTKREFFELFGSALGSAAEQAERTLGHSIPRDFTIELHGAGCSGKLLSIADAFDRLFLGEDTFYRIIDVSVIAISPTQTTIFVRPSSHQPSTFDNTWNQPIGSGPFKQIYAEHIRVDQPV